MRKAFNCYKNGDVKSGKTPVDAVECGIKKTGVGEWSFSDCLDFDAENWRYSLPMEINGIEIEHSYDAENKTMSISVKKDGALFDCRGFTIALNYEDAEELQTN